MAEAEETGLTPPIGPRLLAPTSTVILLLSGRLSAQTGDAKAACHVLDGSIIISQDDDHEFLGKIASAYDAKSIFNSYGTYGNEFSEQSIWNEFSEYGNEFSMYSPFNKFSTQPPMIIKDGKVIAYLSNNSSLQGAIPPKVLKAVCEDEL